MSQVPARVLSARARSERIAFRRGVSLLVLTFLVPGSAQVIAGGVGLGRFALKVWMGLWAAALAFVGLALVNRSWAMALYLHPVTQWIASIVIVALGLGWAWLFLDAWRISHPRQMGRPRKYAMAALSSLVALSVGLGSTQAAALSQSQATLFGSVFGGGGDSRLSDGRINVLLVGADTGPDRRGTRTDTMMVASVDGSTGRTVLFSLPRNLQGVRFPRTSPLAKLYPGGYECPDQSCLLNAVYALGHEHADLYRGSRDPGLQALREAVSETLGLKLNYHAIIDMAGFEKMVDAVGGVTLDIAKAVPIGGGSAPVEGYIQPGRGVHLNGFEALWFARSRHGASDYERMTRQKCVMNALAKQTSPLTVVTRFRDLAEAGSATVSTDVPGTDVGRLVELANAGRRLPIASVSFAPPLIEPSRPDLGVIRTEVRNAIKASQELDRQAAKDAARTAAPAADAPASPAPAAPAPAPAATSAPAPASTASGKASKGTPSPTPTQPPVIAKSAPKPTASFSEERTADDLTEICGVS